MSAAPVCIEQVGTVFVPVTDQGRALDFYVGKLGFQKRFDFPYGGGRWVEVAPPGSAHWIALVPLGEGTTDRSKRTYCAFETRSIEETHAALRKIGVDVSGVARKGSKRTGMFSDAISIADPVPPQFFIRDPDGNQFLVVEVG
jgi:catechol 2,3-dioxygenase-like lactoylglutathione lyase family enzyme